MGSLDCIVHGVARSRTWLSDYHCNLKKQTEDDLLKVLLRKGLCKPYFLFHPCLLILPFGQEEVLGFHPSPPVRTQTTGLSHWFDSLDEESDMYPTLEVSTTCVLGSFIKNIIQFLPSKCLLSGRGNKIMIRLVYHILVKSCD